MIEKHELSKNIININDFHSFDFNRIDPRALRDLQNRSEAPPGPPRDLPVAAQDFSKLPGPPQTPQRAHADTLHEQLLHMLTRFMSNFFTC